MGFRPRKLSLTLLQVIAQRVSSAKIYIDSKIYSSIGKGVLAYVFFEKDDSEEAIEKFMSKIMNFSFFQGDRSSMSASLREIGG